MMDTDAVTNRGARLKAARQKVFPSARQAAFALGIPVATYSAHEHAQQEGGRDYTADEAQLYGKRFGVPWEHLLMGSIMHEQEHDAVPSKTTMTVPMVGYIDLFAEVKFTTKGGEVPAVPEATLQTVAVQFKNNSQGDYDGWLAYYNDIRQAPTAALHGRVCVVALPDRHTYLRRLLRAKSGGGWHLVSNSKSAPEMLDVKPVWAARVFLMRER